MNKQNREIEVRFLHIDKDLLIKNLHNLQAEDLGEFLLKEIIFYDPKLEYLKEGKVVRLRSNNGKITLAYKHHTNNKIDGAEEIEFDVNSIEKAKDFLEKVGLIAYREQEKKRHTFKMEDTTIDIDTWPSLPPYVEIEGETEEEVKMISQQLGFNWEDAIFENAKIVIEKYYNIPVSKLRSFTFDKIE